MTLFNGIKGHNFMFLIYFDDDKVALHSFRNLYTSQENTYIVHTIFIASAITLNHFPSGFRSTMTMPLRTRTTPTTGDHWIG